MLNLIRMIECHFCDLKRNSNNTVLRETPYCIVLVSIPQKQSGHILVVPKRHVEKIDELNSEELTDIFETIKLCHTKLIDGLGNAGCDISQHYRPYKIDDGVKVSHLHFHMIPRNAGDDIERYRNHERELHKNPDVKENTMLLELFEEEQ